jgi:hypothetical protein
MPDRKARRVKPRTWLRDLLERLVCGRTKAHGLARLQLWIWQAERLADAAHA